MLCIERIDLGPNMPPVMRIRHLLKIECNGCKKRFPSQGVSYDGSEWDERFQALQIMRKHGLSERIEGRMMRYYCKKCDRA